MGTDDSSRARLKQWGMEEYLAGSMMESTEIIASCGSPQFEAKMASMKMKLLQRGHPASAEGVVAAGGLDPGSMDRLATPGDSQ
jgi:hypothetical protein